MSFPNPYDFAEMLRYDETAQPEYQLAGELVEVLLAAYADIGTHPKWSHLWDQASRSAQSLGLNFAEGCTKAQGYYRNALMTSRGECGELMFAASHLPADLRAKLTPMIVEFRKLIDARIAACPADKATAEKWPRR